MDYLPGIAKGFRVDISPVTAYLQDANNGNVNATDLAIGGTTSGDVNVINTVLPKPVLRSFLDQITAYINSPGLKTDDLCVIWIGANDFAAAIDPVKTVTNIKSQIARLSKKAGVKNFFVLTVPDFALTPQEKALGRATVLAATQFVVTTNVLLAVELPRFAIANQIRIDLVDINAIFAQVIFNRPGLALRTAVGPLTSRRMGPCL